MARARGAGRTVLVALDFDGTIAPIVRRPERVRIAAPTLRSLREAARIPGVRIAILSARPLRDLARYLPVSGVLRVAQYGLEGDLAGSRRPSSIRAGIVRLGGLLEPVAGAFPGAWIEDKELTLSIHFREVAARSRGALNRALGRVTARARRLGLRAERGSQVLDFVPARYDKGRALRKLRRRLRPAVTFYFGDTAGDEPAFAALPASDFPVRVGAGPTSAPYRVRGPDDVARFLRAIAKEGRHRTRR